MAARSHIAHQPDQPARSAERDAAEAGQLKFSNGERAALEAAASANSAYDRGDIAKYEFWQWVCMDINQRRFEMAPIRRNKH